MWRHVHDTGQTLAGTRAGHNGGPPLDDYAGPRWGKGDPAVFLHWERAHRAAWRSVSRDVMLRRLAKAEACGLTYREYTLEILERGRFLQPDDAAEIAAVKARRRRSGVRRAG